MSFDECADYSVDLSACWVEDGVALPTRRCAGRLANALGDRQFHQAVGKYA